MPILLVRIALGLALAYASLLVLAWLFQERLAFPAPRAPVPDPRRLGIAHAERVDLAMADGTKLAGWYLQPRAREGAEGRAPALLWFYGNGENVASIWPVLRDFQPPGAAVLALDYPGYGGSEGRATEEGIYAAADAAWAALAARPEVDPNRIYVYGRSLGSAAATYVATRHPAAGLILESPFTNAADMARQAYRILPRFIVRLSLDNLSRIRQVRCPVLVFHGTLDRLIPVAMGVRVAAAAPVAVKVVLLYGSGHNDTYNLGGAQYREKLWAFVAGEGGERQ